MCSVVGLTELCAADGDVSSLNGPGNYGVDLDCGGSFLNWLPELVPCWGKRSRLITKCHLTLQWLIIHCLCRNRIWCVLLLTGSLFLYSHRAEVPPLSQCSRHWWTNMYCSWVNTKEWARNEDIMFGMKQDSTVFMSMEIRFSMCQWHRKKAMEYIMWVNYRCAFTQ